MSSLSLGVVQKHMLLKNLCKDSETVFLPPRVSRVITPVIPSANAGIPFALMVVATDSCGQILYGDFQGRGKQCVLGLRKIW
jgi:hypothetical protein